MHSLCQMSRLHRELERLTEERDRARDEVKRSEQHRQQLEAELKVCDTQPGGTCAA